MRVQLMSDPLELLIASRLSTNLEERLECNIEVRLNQGIVVHDGDLDSITLFNSLQCGPFVIEEIEGDGCCSLTDMMPDLC